MFNYNSEIVLFKIIFKNFTAEHNIIPSSSAPPETSTESKWVWDEHLENQGPVVYLHKELTVCGWRVQLKGSMTGGNR